MGSSSGLLSLPTELQLQIALYLVGDGKRDGKTDTSIRSLLNTSLTCRHLASAAREALCTAGVLQSSKVDILIAFLFKYPDLRSKIKHLTIETQETRKDKAYTAPISRLDPSVLSASKQHIRHLPVLKPIQDQLIRLLKAPRFQDHSIPLALLLTMLPSLTHLLLGGSILLNFPLFAALVPNAPEDTHASTSGWRTAPDQTWLLDLVGPRLTHLELPVDLRRSPDANIWTPVRVVALPVRFPRLRWLSVPHMAATEMTVASAGDVVPPHLKTLVLTDARCACFEQFAKGLVDDEGRSLFPELRRVEMYHRYPSPGTGTDVLEKLAGAGVQVFEYDPNCCLRSNDEFYHPWRYTPEEIGALEEGRHKEYETERDRAALQCGSDGE